MPSIPSERAEVRELAVQKKQPSTTRVTLVATMAPTAALPRSWTAVKVLHSSSAVRMIDAIPRYLVDIQVVFRWDALRRILVIGVQASL